MKKGKKLRVPRNNIARSLLETSFYRHQAVPNKKGKGSVYSRKGRKSDDGSGLCRIWAPVLNFAA